MTNDYGLEPRDRLLILNLAIQYDEQLAAIRAVLALHRRAGKEIEEERRSIEAGMKNLDGAAYYHAEDEWGANFYRSVYADASYSIGALVMIAPFVEALFYQVYLAIRQ
jgi:VIT1/CCC1 family predicted Fe2+/Mn2+ transporter